MSKRVQLFLAGAGLAVFAALVVADGAVACRSPRPAYSLIAAGNYDTVVLVRVTEAGYEGKAGKDWKPWRGVAKLTQVISGHTDLTTFTFGRTGSSAACDDGIPPPKPGDIWALYLRQGNSQTLVVHSYPLGIARAADPKLARQLSDSGVH